jgi:hypothetical protein
MEMMARIWRQPAPWRERGADPADGHRHSDPVGPYQPLSSWNPPGWPSLLSEESRRPDALADAQSEAGDLDAPGPLSSACGAPFGYRCPSPSVEGCDAPFFASSSFASDSVRLLGAPE